MPICVVTFAIGILVAALAGIVGLRFGNVKVGAVSGTLAAVLIVLAVLNVGC